ncbi:MAG TPA: hypothetical protein VF124_04530 [Gaiellaceae bacterium]
MKTDAAVQIPGKAVSQDDDVEAPVVGLLESLHLLSKDERDGTGFATAFTGPSQSVAVIESGVTAATKWWATGIGATLIVTWGRLLTWWGRQPLGVKEAALGGAFFVTAVGIGAIGYLFASDVRGRATAAAATIAAREHVALAMIAAAEVASKNGAPVADGEGTHNGSREYLLLRGSDELVLDPDQLGFERKERSS